jgi:ABC-type bacteriocin/lantibiotic exporter with double-glycine peptidase domain
VPNSLKINGKEVTNPITKILFISAVCALIGIIVFPIVGTILLTLTVIICILVVVAVLSIPLHFILKLCGRKGFSRTSENGGFSWEVTGAGFKKK